MADYVPRCDIEGALYLGRRPGRYQLSKQWGHGFKAPDGYYILEQGKEIFAIPDSARHEGCNGLGCKACGWTGYTAEFEKRRAKKRAKKLAKQRP